MSAKTRKKQKRITKTERQAIRIYDGDSRLNYLAVMPALILLAVTLIELLMDISMPSMKYSQFSTYTDLFRMGSWLCLITGVLFIAAYLHIYGKGVFSKEKLRAGISGQLHWVFFALFAVCILISTFVNGIDDAALHGIPYRNQGFLHFLFYLCILCPVAMGVRNAGLRKLILRGYLVVADFIVLAAALYLSGVKIDPFTGKKGLCAIFFNANHYGYFLVMAVLIAAGLWIVEEKREWRCFALLSYIADLTMLFINDSLGCMIAVAAVLIVTFIMLSVQERRVHIRSAAVLAIFVVLPLAGACVLKLRSASGASAVSRNISELVSVIKSAVSGDISDSAGHNRWGLWVLTAGYISEKPLFGYGCEGISGMLQAAAGRSDAHNEVLTFAAYFGIPAALFYVAGVVTSFIKVIRERISVTFRLPFFMAAAGYFLSSLAGVSMFYTAPFFFLFLGAMLTSSE